MVQALLIPFNYGPVYPRHFTIKSPPLELFFKVRDNGSMEAKDLAEALVAEGHKRKDRDYIEGTLYERQRKINAAIMKFAGDDIPDNARVLDACAGPGGLASAGATERWRVVSNDLAKGFAEHVKAEVNDDVVISSATDLPYLDKCFDAVFYVYAINNILRVDRVMSETARVLQPEGKMVVADPGPSMWMAKVALHEAVGDSAYRKSTDYFENKKYTAGDYMDFVAVELLGIDRTELDQKIKEIYEANSSSKEKKSIPFLAREMMAELYLRNLLKKAENHGMVLEMVGVGVADSLEGPQAGVGQKDWTVANEIYNIVGEPGEEIIEKIMSLRKTPGKIRGLIGDMTDSQQSPQMRPQQESEHKKGSEQRMVYPVLVFRKETSG